MTCEPEILVLGSRHDLTCDFVVSALRRKGVPYLRLNSEDLPAVAVDLDPTSSTLSISLAESTFLLSERSLRSVLFRRPTFLRCHGGSTSEPRAELLRAHWASFLRSLMLFDTALWVNDPQHTYLAEHKALQLKRASKLGFSIPRTRIANTVAAVPSVALRDDRIVVKGLDTVLLREADQEVFGFTQFVDPAALTENDLCAAPVILQEGLERKTDLRITVVGRSVFAVEITRDGRPIDGDWRCSSRDADYTPIPLPHEVQQRCVALVESLGLRFGAINIAVQDGCYYVSAQRSPWLTTGGTSSGESRCGSSAW